MSFSPAEIAPNPPAPDNRNESRAVAINTSIAWFSPNRTLGKPGGRLLGVFVPGKRQECHCGTFGRVPHSKLHGIEGPALGRPFVQCRFDLFFADSTQFDDLVDNSHAAPAVQKIE